MNSKFIAIFFFTTATLLPAYQIISLPRRRAIISADKTKKPMFFTATESSDRRIRSRRSLSTSLLMSIQPTLDSSRYSVSFPSGTYENIALLYTRCSCVSWWIQIILSVIAGVILTFSNSVRQNSERGVYFLWTSGFIFSAAGVFISFVSSLWTWNMTRLKRRLSLNEIKENAILPTLKRSSKISVVLSLVGMFVTLLGAEQIVGTLASKVLMNPGFFPIASANSQQGALQALDIFLVQANTNVLVSHFACLVCYIYLQTQLPQLRFVSESTVAKATNTTINSEEPPKP